MLVVLSLPMPFDHVVEESGHTSTYVCPEDRASHVEPSVSRAQDFVVGMVRETTIGSNVRECFLECNDTMLHKGERTKPEDCDTRASVSSPMSVEVHLDILVEDTVTTFDCLSVDTLSEITNLLGVALHSINGLPSVRLIER